MRVGFKDVIKTGNGQRTRRLKGKLKMETKPLLHYLYPLFSTLMYLPSFKEKTL